MNVFGSIRKAPKENETIIINISQIHLNRNITINLGIDTWKKKTKKKKFSISILFIFFYYIFPLRHPRMFLSTRWEVIPFYLTAPTFLSRRPDSRSLSSFTISQQNSAASAWKATSNPLSPPPYNREERWK